MSRNVLSGIDIASFSNTKVYNEIEALKNDINQLKLKYETNNIKSINSNQRGNNISLKELTKNGNTCRSLIEKIFYEKYFESEKLLGEVHEELTRMGYNYDRTAVSHSLTDMVREGILTRVGTSEIIDIFRKNHCLRNNNYYHYYYFVLIFLVIILFSQLIPAVVIP